MAYVRRSHSTFSCSVAGYAYSVTTIPTTFANCRIITPGPSSASEDAQVTLGVKYLAGPAGTADGVAAATAIAKRVQNAFRQFWITNAVSSWSFSRVEVNLNLDGEFYAAQSLGSGAGPNVAPAMPPSVALLATKVTTLGGRSNRGRWFLGGVFAEATANDAGRLTPATTDYYNTQLGLFTAQLRLPAGTDTAQLELYLLHGPVKSTGITPEPTRIERFEVSSTLATQRRRLR